MVATRKLFIRRMCRQPAAIFLGLGGTRLQIEASGSKQEAAAVITAPLVHHSVKALGGWSVSVVINPLHPRYLALCAFAEAGIKVLDRRSFAHLHGRLADAFVSNLGDACVAALVDDVLSVVLGTRPAEPRDYRVAWILDVMQTNIDAPFEQLAADLRLSTSRLSHLFSQNMGLSFRSYQAWARAARALEFAVLRPDLSFTQIAHHLGFADLAHLSRKFRQTFGLAPTQLRDPFIVHVMGRFSSPCSVLARGGARQKK